MAQDPYKELGVARGAARKNLASRFRKLAKQHHPDANPGNKESEERFKRLQRRLRPPRRYRPAQRSSSAGEIDADGRETMRGVFRQGPFGGQKSPLRRSRGGSSSRTSTSTTSSARCLAAAAVPSVGAAHFAVHPARMCASELEIDLEEAIKGAKKRVAFSDGRTLDVAIPVGAAEARPSSSRARAPPGRAGAS